MHLRQHESGRCGLLGVLPWLTLPGHWLHVLAAPDTRWAVLSSTIVCAVKQFSHHFPPWRQSAHSLLTRVLTSFRFHLGILLSRQAPIHPLTDSPERVCASSAGLALGRYRQPPPPDRRRNPSYARIPHCLQAFEAPKASPCEERCMFQCL